MFRTVYSSRPDVSLPMDNSYNLVNPNLLLESVSIKCRLRTADCRLGIKCRLQTADRV